MSYGLSLVYNGQAWMYRQDAGFPEAVPVRTSNAGLGWQVTMGELVAPLDPLNRAPGHWVYVAPDGAERTFYSVLHPEERGSGYEAPGNPTMNQVAGYTRDSSYYRLTYLGLVLTHSDPGGIHQRVNYYEFRYLVESPDGMRYTFGSVDEFSDEQTLPSDSESRGLSYQLREIRDRFDNTVTVTYPDAYTWTITDKHGRVQTVHFTSTSFYEYRNNAQARYLVSSIDLTAFNGQTATYTFNYSPYTTISEPCDDGYQNGTADQPVDRTQKTIFLNSLTLPDGSSYGMAYNGMMHTDPLHPGIVTCSDAAGHLTSITLPTGGRIEYDIGKRSFPHYVEEYTGPGSLTAERPVDHSAAITTRRLIDRDGTTSSWTYGWYLRNIGAYNVSTQSGGFTQAQIARTLVVVTTDPLGRRTAQYFDVDKIGDVGCYPGGTAEDEYGLPFTHAAGTSSGNFLLSSEVYDTSCTATPLFLNDTNRCGPSQCMPVRTTYVQYTHDTPSHTSADNPSDQNKRLVGSMTVFNDDINCAGAPCSTQSVMSDFDGLGHDRTETASSNFPGDTTRVKTTHYNRGTYTAGAANVPSSYMIAPDAPWLLNLYDYATVTENGQTARTETCFEAGTGFLTRVRTSRGDSTGPNDLLTVNGRDTAGNITSETYYGGDVRPLGSFTTCSSTPSTYDYQLQHTYSRGARLTSKYSGTSFFALDLVRDPNTSLPSASRDSAVIPTTYTWDTSGRLTGVQPYQDAQTTYAYTTTAAETNVVVQQLDGNGGVLTDKRIFFDGIGRPTLHKTRLPDGTWATTRTHYDLAGRADRMSTPESRTVGSYETTTFTPAHETAVTFDRFDRPYATTAPDGTQTITTYLGTREVNRYQSIESDSGTRTAVHRETYDGAGRLAGVTDSWNGDPTGAVTAAYTYDVGGRLHTVAMGNQTRTCAYDRTGLLTDEQHPEKGALGWGTTHYLQFDARGHARRRTDGPTGTPFDLTYTYDAAERITNVQEIIPSSASFRSVTDYTFGTSGNAKGKLLTATRHHYDGTLGNIDVTETYAYNGRGGRVSQRTTTVGPAPQTTSILAPQTFTMSQSYDPLGNVDTLSYPTCSACGVGPSRTIQYAYTAGALTSVLGYAPSITYQPNGLISSLTHAGGTTETWTPDASGMPRPASIAAKQGAVVLWTSGNYAYDAAGNIKQIGGDTYRYDHAGRLTSWASGPQHSYVRYDVYGNQIERAFQYCTTTDPIRCFGGNSSPIAYVNDSNHVREYSYDEAGNVTGDTLRGFLFDAIGTMHGEAASGREFRFLYTADGERVAIVEGTSNVTWEARGFGNQLLRMWTESLPSHSWTWKEDSIWRGSLLLANESAAGTKHYTLDHLGSPRAITDNAGVLFGTQSFQPFGEGGTIDGGALQFTGHERDSAIVGGLAIDLPDSLHARFYDRGGRFLSVDPTWSSADLGRPQSWNRYAYVGNSPLGRVDPDGRCSALVGVLAFPLCGMLDLIDYAHERGGQFLEAVQGMGPSASTKERLIGGAVVGIVALDVGSNAIEPEKAALEIRLGNIFNQELTRATISAAAQEVHGATVATKPSGVAFDHVTKMNQAMSGARNAMQTLTRWAGDGRLTPTQRDEVMRMISKYSKKLDQAEKLFQNLVEYYGRAR